MRTFFNTTVLLVVLSLGLVACENSASDSKPSVMAVPRSVFSGFDFSVVKTVGDHSYLQINRPIEPDKMVLYILAVLDAFEKSHRDLKVTSWAIEKDQHNSDSHGCVFGLWINHEPVDVKPKE